MTAYGFGGFKPDDKVVWRGISGKVVEYGDLAYPWGVPVLLEGSLRRLTTVVHCYELENQPESTDEDPEPTPSLGNLEDYYVIELPSDVALSAFEYICEHDLRPSEFWKLAVETVLEESGYVFSGIGTPGDPLENKNDG